MGPLWSSVFLVIATHATLKFATCHESQTGSRSEKIPKDTLSEEVLPLIQFKCKAKDPGYYADADFGCKLFHYCNQDGQRKTIICSKNNSHDHKICAFKEISSKACKRTNIYFALPEDLSFGDTTAATVNSATEFKLPRVISGTTISTEAKSLTTPLISDYPLNIDDSQKSASSETSQKLVVINDNKMRKKEEKRKESDFGDQFVYEVSNSPNNYYEDFNIDRYRNLYFIDPPPRRNLRQLPATFSRGTKKSDRFNLITKNENNPKSLELKEKRDEKIEVLKTVIASDDYLFLQPEDLETYRKNKKENDKLLKYNSKLKHKDKNPHLVEVYDKNFDKNLSDLINLKNLPGTHPRRRKRMIVKEVIARRPYAVFYAKVPDTSRPVSSQSGRKPMNPKPKQKTIELALEPIDISAIPIAIEVPKKRKPRKPNTKPALKPQVIYDIPNEEEHQQHESQNPHFSEQQNIFYLSDQQGVPGATQNNFEKEKDTRIVVNPDYRLRDVNAPQQNRNTGISHLENNSNQNRQQVNRPTVIISRPPNGNFNNFPFPPPFLSRPVQPPFLSDPRSVASNEEFPPQRFTGLNGGENQERPRPRPMNLHSRPSDSESRPFQNQPHAQRQSNNIPQQPSAPENIRNPSIGSSEAEQTSFVPPRQGFQHPFFQNFPPLVHTQDFNYPFLRQFRQFSPPSTASLGYPSSSEDQQQPPRAPFRFPLSSQEQQQPSPQLPFTNLQQPSHSALPIQQTPQGHIHSSGGVSVGDSFTPQLPTRNSVSQNQLIQEVPPSTRLAGSLATSNNGVPKVPESGNAIINEHKFNLNGPRSNANVLRSSNEVNPNIPNQRPDRQQSHVQDFNTGPAQTFMYNIRPAPPQSLPVQDIMTISHQDTRSHQQPEVNNLRSRPQEAVIPNTVHRPSLQNVNSYPSSKPEQNLNPTTQQYLRQNFRTSPQQHSTGGYTTGQLNQYQSRPNTNLQAVSPERNIQSNRINNIDNESHRQREQITPSGQYPALIHSEHIRNHPISQTGTLGNQRQQFPHPSNINGIRQQRPPGIANYNEKENHSDNIQQSSQFTNNGRQYGQNRGIQNHPHLNQMQTPQVLRQPVINRRPDVYDTQDESPRHRFSRPSDSSQNTNHNAPNNNIQGVYNHRLQNINPNLIIENTPRRPPQQHSPTSTNRGQFHQPVRNVDSTSYDSSSREKPILNNNNIAPPASREYGDRSYLPTINSQPSHNVARERNRNILTATTPNRGRTRTNSESGRLDSPRKNTENSRNAENPTDKENQGNKPDPSQTTATTHKPIPKVKPLPPRPTFPSFPTFPPPPRRRTSTSQEESTTESLTAVTVDPLAHTRNRQNSRSRITASENSASAPDYSGQNINIEHSQQTNHTQTAPKRTRTRKRLRKKRPRRPKTTTSSELELQEHLTTTTSYDTAESSARTSGRRYNYQRRPTTPIPLVLSSTTIKETVTEPTQSEEFGSRIKLFGRQRPPPKYTPRVTTTTPEVRNEDSETNDVKKSTRLPGRAKVRRPYRKRVNSIKTTTSEPLSETESIARSDENSDSLQYQGAEDIEIITETRDDGQMLESTTMSTVFSTVTEPYNQFVDYSTRISVLINDGTEILLSDTNNKLSSENARPVLKKFRNRPRLLKFGKPSLLPSKNSNNEDIDVAESETVESTTKSEK